ncbi:MAG TPA: hypothetical protein O0X27_03855 [Methanocorpusculum sp.]|nr:hypothetical protein [Methanocorpusculum sp.]
MSSDNSPTDIVAEAENLALAGKFDEALKKYNEAATSDPTNPLIAVGKSTILKAQGKYAECAETLGIALESLSSWNVAKEDMVRYNQFTSMLHVLRAEAYLYAQDLSHVFSELDEADKVSGADAASMVVRANAHAQKKEWNEAGDLLYRAEEWCFQHEDSMLTQIWQSKVQYAKDAGGVFAPPYAAEIYKNGHWRTPKGTVDELLERAGNLRKAGLLYDALHYYDAALAQATENKAHILFLKGVVYEQLKRFDDAFGCYSDALAANPTQEEEFMIRVRWSNTKALRGL